MWSANFVAKTLSITKNESIKLVKDLYKLRSRIVHEEETVDVDKKTWLELCTICRKGIIKCWVDCDSFETSLQNTEIDIDKTSSVTFILPEGCSFLLDALARFLALCNQLAHQGKGVSIDFSFLYVIINPQVNEIQY